MPTARSDRAYNWGQSAIAPDAVGYLVAGGHPVPFYLEPELRARHPRGVIARLDPYEDYYWSPEHEEDQPPYPVTLFVVDTEEMEETYVSAAARMNRMSAAHPGLLHARPVTQGDIGGVLASPVGAVLPPTGAVRHGFLRLRLAVPPDAAHSCRGVP